MDGWMDGEEGGGEGGEGCSSGEKDEREGGREKVDHPLRLSVFM